jgi:hypothetical protein
VEDLWDDLAATPSEVPVHEWQKFEIYSSRNFSKSPGTLGSYGNKPPGKGNRFSSASNALNRWLVRFYMKWLDACVQRFPLPYVAN